MLHNIIGLSIFTTVVVLLTRRDPPITPYPDVVLPIVASSLHQSKIKSQSRRIVHLLPYPYSRAFTNTEITSVHYHIKRPTNPTCSLFRGTIMQSYMHDGPIQLPPPALGGEEEERGLPRHACGHVRTN